MSYKLSGRVERKVHVVRKERSAIVPQKSAYCEEWSSTPGRITDDTEAEERNVVQIAGLRNGSGLHIDSQSSREAAFDGIQLCAVGDKPVAGTYQSAMNTAFQSGLVQRQSMFQKRGAPLVHCRQSLHLTVLVTVTAPYIVVRQRVARHYIRHLEASVDAARHTGTHNTVRGKTAYQLRSSHRRIHLTDAAIA